MKELRELGHKLRDHWRKFDPKNPPESVLFSPGFKASSWLAAHKISTCVHDTRGSFQSMCSISTCELKDLGTVLYAWVDVSFSHVSRQIVVADKISTCVATDSREGFQSKWFIRVSTCDSKDLDAVRVCLCVYCCNMGKFWPMFSTS